MGFKSTVQMGGTPNIYEVTCTLADTEYSQEVALGAVTGIVQARTSHDVRIAFVTGAVAAGALPYITIKADTVFTLDNAKLVANRTMYVASGNAGTVVEILTWSVV